MPSGGSNHFATVKPAAGPTGVQSTFLSRFRNSVASASGSSSGAKAVSTAWCWAEHPSVNLVLHDMAASASKRCLERHATLAAAQAACEAAKSWCGGVTRDSGIECRHTRLEYELRLSREIGTPPSTSVTSWLLHHRARNSTRCEGPTRRHSTSSARAEKKQQQQQQQQRPGSGGGNGNGNHQMLMSLPPVAADDRLGRILRAKLSFAQRRVERGPPAYERFPEQAFRYRDWGGQTRHGRGDMYPLYTLDTLRNMADFLFDSSTGYETGPDRARKVQPCDLIYSTLRPTSKFINLVHSHISVPYLLMTDTADEPITAYHGVKQLLSSNTMMHWWAVDNEVLDSEKLDSLPLGVMDALELGVTNNPGSVTFHANVSDYVRTLILSHAQPKSLWLMMQMTETHPERRRVRSTLISDRWGDHEVRLTPERRGKMGVREYLMQLGQHKFVLSPRGNGLDAHRTWEALLVGSIPIVRSSALNPLYEGLPVLIVNDWNEVTPDLLRNFLHNHTVRLPYYHYEKLFADYWIGQFGVHRERCLAEERARRAPKFVYDYKARGGWVALGSLGQRRPTPVWTHDAARGGRR